MCNVRYAVISPVRNEAQYLPSTVASMVCQTIQPQKWVIVDDGSTDETGGIADQAAAKHDWIRAIHRGDRGFRLAGGGVMEAFYAGYEVLEKSSYDFIVKLDGD